MKIPNIQVALFGLMQSFTKSSEHEDVVYTHWDGTEHRLPWQDVVQIVECTVQESEQLDRLRLKMAQHAENYGMSKAQLQSLARGMPWHGTAVECGAKRETYYEHG